MVYSFNKKEGILIYWNPLKILGAIKKMKESLFNYRFEYENQKYIFNTNNNGLIQINNDIFTEEEREYLRVNRFWVDDNEDEIALLEREINHNIQKRQKELELTIALTNYCNFSCVYCYQNKNEKLMTTEVANMIIEKIDRILNDNIFEGINIHYFGGEPLLNIPVLIYLDENIKKITDKIGIVYKAFLTSNGSMLSKELLQKVKFSSIQLTFDGLEKTHDRLRVSDHFHFKEEIELIENIMNFSQAKVLLRTNICKENKDEIIALHKYIFEKFGNERIEINPNRTIKYHQDDSFEMLSVQEYAEVAYQIKLLWSEQKGKFELPVPRSTPCKFPYGNAYAISPEGYCTFCSGSMDQEKKYFFDVDIENKKMFSVRKECKKCNILPLCLGGCIIQYNLRAGACTYEKYELKNILISYIKHIS